MYPRLKILRESLGLTQEEFGKSLNIAKSTYNNYETGIRDPKSDFWIAVALKYGVTIDYLMGYSDDPHQASESAKRSQSLSSDEQTHIKKYRLLDSYGKEAVDSVLDVESRRCEAEKTERAAKAAAIREQRAQAEAAEQIVPEKVIRFRVPEYTSPMSAGLGEVAGSEFPQDRELVKAPPRGTSYISHVRGDSMEPTYHDGDMVFVHACEDIPVGKVGVFWMNGQQWVKERGDGVLISHNSDEYAPIFIREEIRCQGLVIGVCDESYFE